MLLRMGAAGEGEEEARWKDRCKDRMTLNLPNIACLDESDIIVGLVAFDYGWQVLQACWEDGVVECEGRLAPLTILCVSGLNVGQAMSGGV